MTHIILIAILLGFALVLFSTVYAEELTIHIPQGDHTRELKTVIEWYVPINHDVELGDVVTWINDDITAHTVTSGKGIGFLGDPKTQQAQPDGYFDSGIIPPGKSWSFTFKEKGFFEYTCTIHPWVERSITVLEPGVDISNVRISYALIVTIISAVLIIAGTIIGVTLRHRNFKNR